MANKLYQLPYDDQIDKDIALWLESLPRPRKAELVRNALRAYIQGTIPTSGSIVVNPSPVVQTKPVEDEAKEELSGKRPKSLPTDGNF